MSRVTGPIYHTVGVTMVDTEAAKIRTNWPTTAALRVEIDKDNQRARVLLHGRSVSASALLMDHRRGDELATARIDFQALALADPCPVLDAVDLVVEAEFDVCRVWEDGKELPIPSRVLLNLTVDSMVWEIE